MQTSVILGLCKLCLADFTPRSSLTQLCPCLYPVFESWWTVPQLRFIPYSIPSAESNEEQLPFSLADHIRWLGKTEQKCGESDSCRRCLHNLRDPWIYCAELGFEGCVINFANLHIAPNVVMHVEICTILAFYGANLGTLLRAAANRSEDHIHWHMLSQGGGVAFWPCGYRECD